MVVRCVAVWVAVLAVGVEAVEGVVVFEEVEVGVVVLSVEDHALVVFGKQGEGVEVCDVDDGAPGWHVDVVGGQDATSVAG